MYKVAIDGCHFFPTRSRDQLARSGKAPGVLVSHEGNCKTQKSVTPTLLGRCRTSHARKGSAFGVTTSCSFLALVLKWAMKGRIAALREASADRKATAAAFGSIYRRHSTARCSSKLNRIASVTRCAPRPDIHLRKVASWLSPAPLPLMNKEDRRAALEIRVQRRGRAASAEYSERHQTCHSQHGCSTWGQAIPRHPYLPQRKNFPKWSKVL